MSTFREELKQQHWEELRPFLLEAIKDHVEDLRQSDHAPEIRNNKAHQQYKKSPHPDFPSHIPIRTRVQGAHDNMQKKCKPYCEDRLDGDKVVHSNRCKDISCKKALPGNSWDGACPVDVSALRTPKASNGECFRFLRTLVAARVAFRAGRWPSKLRVPHHA